MRTAMILDAPFPPDARVENEARVLLEAGCQVHLLHLDFSRYQRYRRSGESVVERLAGHSPNNQWNKVGRGLQDASESVVDVSERVDRGAPAAVKSGNLFDTYTWRGIRVWRAKGGRLPYKASALAVSLPFYRWWARPLVRRFLQQCRPALIHVHDMVIAGAVLETARPLGLPVILDLHEDRPEIMKEYRHVRRFPGRLLISPDRWLARQRDLMEQASHVILVTEQARQVASERDGISLDKTTALPNVVWREQVSHEEPERNPATQTSSDDRFSLLYIGDTSLRRGTGTAVEALSLLGAEMPELQLLLVGSSSQDDELKTAVKRRGVEHRVKFEGWQPAERLPSYIRAADLCLSPLLRNPHHDTTFANKLFQYMAGGKPVLVSDCPAQAAVVESEKCGLIHRAGDAGSLAEAVRKVRKDPFKSREMGRRGRAAVEKRWNWEAFAPRLETLYRELIDGSAKSETR